jgi:WD40 repeat protein
LRLLGHVDAITDVVDFGEGDEILSASWDGTLRLWNRRDGTPIQVFEGLSSPIEIVAVSETQDFAVTVGRDSIVRKWDLRTGRRVMDLQGNTAEILVVRFVGNDGRIVTGDGDGNVVVWDAIAGSMDCIATLHGEIVEVSVQAADKASDLQIIAVDRRGRLTCWTLSA